MQWMESLAERAGDHDAAVQQLLHAVRTHLGMQVAWTSEFVGGEQVFRFVDAEPGATAPVVGSRGPLSGSYCARVLDGRLPGLIPDSRHEPSTALLDITHELQIGSYLGVPLTGVDGTVDGMLCAVSSTATPTLSERDLETLRLLAQLLHDLQARALDAAAVRSARERFGLELDAVIRGGGRWCALQPVLDVTTGAVVIVEGLSRFSSERTPAEWFDAAARAGRSPELELAAARSVLDLLVDGGVPDEAALSVNLSPGTVVGPGFDELLADVDPSRVVVEVTEHQPVADYEALATALDPWRAKGLRLAVDDAGAGFASLRHVLVCRPDIVKLDMALVRGVDSDPVRRSLVEAVCAFTGAQGMTLVAEGVETEAERDALVRVGLALLQGYLIGRPQDARRTGAGTAP